MIDVAPALLDKVEKKFNDLLDQNSKLNRLKRKIEAGEATYVDANTYAVEVGKSLSEAFKEITPEDLPDGKMYYNIAEKTIKPPLEQEYEIVSEMTERVQKGLNTKAGLGLNAVKPELDYNRVQGFLDKLADAERFEAIEWLLGEPVINFAQSVVDESVRQNADFQTKAGLRPKIIRTAEAPGTRTVVRGKRKYIYVVPCKWCANLEGVYDYYEVSNTGNDVFRRHENCRCIVKYDPGDGRKQDVWSKEWDTPNPQDVQERVRLAKEIEARGEITIANSKSWEELENVLREKGLEIDPEIRKTTSFTKAKSALINGAILW